MWGSGFRDSKLQRDILGALSKHLLRVDPDPVLPWNMMKKKKWCLSSLRSPQDHRGSRQGGPGVGPAEATHLCRVMRLM